MTSLDVGFVLDELPIKIVESKASVVTFPTPDDNSVLLNPVVLILPDVVIGSSAVGWTVVKDIDVGDVASSVVGNLVTELVVKFVGLEMEVVDICILDALVVSSIVC